MKNDQISSFIEDKINNKVKQLQAQKDFEKSGLSTINEAIKRLDSLGGLLCKDTISYIRGRILVNLLPYEAARDRKIAEDAWDACVSYYEDDSSIVEPDKQTYLNQNHPL